MIELTLATTKGFLTAELVPICTELCGGAGAEVVASEVEPVARHGAQGAVRLRRSADPAARPALPVALALAARRTRTLFGAG
jgi:hypothetical protein